MSSISQSCLSVLIDDEIIRLTIRPARIELNLRRAEIWKTTKIWSTRACPSTFAGANFTRIEISNLYYICFDVVINTSKNSLHKNSEVTPSPTTKLIFYKGNFNQFYGFKKMHCKFLNIIDT